MPLWPTPGRRRPPTNVYGYPYRQPEKEKQPPSLLKNALTLAGATIGAPILGLGVGLAGAITIEYNRTPSVLEASPDVPDYQMAIHGTIRDSQTGEILEYMALASLACEVTFVGLPDITLTGEMAVRKGVTGDDRGMPFEQTFTPLYDSCEKAVGAIHGKDDKESELIRTVEGYAAQYQGEGFTPEAAVLVRNDRNLLPDLQLIFVP